MKKLFYAFMIAAATLFGACTDAGSEITLPEGYDNTALVMTDAEVLSRGNNYASEGGNYIVYLYDNSGDRRVAFEIKASDAVDNVPVGTFSIADGTMFAGSNDKGVFAGSHYLRLTASTAITLIEEATLTIAKNEDGTFSMNAKIAGAPNIALEEPSNFVDVECTYKGVPAHVGLDGEFATIEPFIGGNSSTVFVYYSIEDGYARWDFEIFDTNLYYVLAAQQILELPGYGMTFTMYTEIPDVEAGEVKPLPLGTFPVDSFSTGYLNTLIGTTALSLLDPASGLIEDIILDGALTIKANGQNSYIFNFSMFGQHDGYQMNFEGPISFSDYTEVELELAGVSHDWQQNVNGDHWVVVLYDTTNTLMAELHIYGKTDDTTNGIPSGRYVVADSTNGSAAPSGAEGVIAMGKNDLSGSVMYDIQTGEPFALIQGGEITINNKGDFNYSIDVNLTDQDNIIYFGSANYSAPTDFPSQYTLSAATATYLGDGGWNIDILDKTKLNGAGLVLRVLVITEPDATFADGLPTGTFQFDTTAAPGTVLAGYYDPSQGAYYSLLISADGRSLYAILSEGEVKISEANGQHTIEVDIADESGNKYIGTFSGTVSLKDNTAANAPKKAASIVDWSNYNKAKSLVERPKLTMIERMQANGPLF